MAKVTDLNRYREKHASELAHFKKVWGREGLCPICRKTDGILNINRHHFMHCKTHRVWWYLGMNRYQGWQQETAEEWDQNTELLQTFEEVEPYLPDRYCDRCGTDYSPSGFVIATPGPPRVSERGVWGSPGTHRCRECVAIVGNHAFRDDVPVCRSCGTSCHRHENHHLHYFAGCCSRCVIALMPGATDIGWQCGECGRLSDWKTSPSLWTTVPRRPLCANCVGRRIPM